MSCIVNIPDFCLQNKVLKENKISTELAKNKDKKYNRRKKSTWVFSLITALLTLFFASILHTLTFKSLVLHFKGSAILFTFITFLSSVSRN